MRKLAILCLSVLLTSCVVSSKQPQMTGGDKSKLDNSTTGLKAQVPVLSPEAKQEHKGFSLVSIQSAGGSALPWLIAIGSLAVNVFLWKRGRTYKTAAGYMIQAIEEQGPDSGIKEAVAKATANNTPFGRFVKSRTQRRNHDPRNPN